MKEFNAENIRAEILVVQCCIRFNHVYCSE